MGPIHLSYAWLCNWKHSFSAWPEGESLRALHVSQTLPWRTAPTWCNRMQFLCTPTMQLVDQPCATVSFAVGSEIHHQKPQPTGFSHIGWLELLPTSHKAKETFLVPYEHNRKTKRCLAHFFSLPRSTRLSRRWTRLGVSSCFSHLGWTKPRKKKGLWGSKLALLVTLRWLDWNVTPY
jgi:hypothetical protein